MESLFLVAGLFILYGLWYLYDRAIVKREGRKLIDCPDCNQTVENCECHIPDEVKHAGLHAMVRDLTSQPDMSKEVVYHEEGILRLIHDIEAQEEENNCPICGRDMDMIFDACDECGFNPYSD